MRVLEGIVIATVALSLWMKFTLIPGGDEFTMLSLTILACFYFPLGPLFLSNISLRDLFKSFELKDMSVIVFAGAAGMGLACIAVGCLYKMLSLVGGGFMILSGIVIVGVVLVVHVARSLIIKDPMNKVLLWRSGFGVLLGIFMMGVSELDIVKLQYRDHPAYVEAYVQYREDLSDESRKKLDLEYHRVILTAEEFAVYEDSVSR
jgi:hypothetical protein